WIRAGLGGPVRPDEPGGTSVPAPADEAAGARVAGDDRRTVGRGDVHARVRQREKLRDHAVDRPAHPRREHARRIAEMQAEAGVTRVQYRDEARPPSVASPSSDGMR